MSAIKIVVEKHSDGYVAYPVGMKGVVVGEGTSYDEALADVKSAIRFHVETFGGEVLTEDDVASLSRLNADGSVTTMTIPSHRALRSSTLRTICTEAGISREEFLRAYDRA